MMQSNSVTHDNNDSDAAAAHVPKRHYVTWSSAAAEALLRLRYDTMQREFAAHTNPLEIATLWTALAAQLRRVSGRKYTSVQCQSKLKSLRAKWRIEKLREGENANDFEAHAIEWITRTNTTKRTRERASAVLAAARAARQSQNVMPSSEPFTELLLASPPSLLVTQTQRQPTIAEPFVLHGEPISSGIEPNDDSRVDYDSRRGDSASDDDQATALEVRETEQALLTLVQRQTRAVEAIASCTTGRSAQELHAEWLAISREQLQLARDQVELNLFLVRAAPDDAVAQEYLTLKRMQARDRAKHKASVLFTHR